MKIRTSGDFVEFTQNGQRHTVRRSDIRRVTFYEENGRIAIEIPGITMVTRIMECSGIKAKTAEQLYHRIAKLMRPQMVRIL